tara:strand:+ start:28 stop:1488 length:1461 start_codon:yes stop_codon:yes gene_type:complete
MSLQPYIRQLKPRNESYTPPVDKVQSLLSEAYNYGISTPEDIDKLPDNFNKDEVKKLLELLMSLGWFGIPIAADPAAGKLKIRNPTPAQWKQIKTWQKDNWSGKNLIQGKGSVDKDITAADWEKVICVAYNIKTGMTQEDAISKGDVDKWDSAFEGLLPAGSAIVDKSFGKSPSGVMKHYGQGTGKLTKEWNDYFIKMTGKAASAPTKTPKTDMMIGKKHISLKKYGGSQLMSGGQSETLATLGFAYKNAPDSIKSKEFDAAWDSLSGDIEDKFIGFSLPAGETVTTIDQGSGKRALKKIIQDAFTGQQAMTDAIRNILTEFEIKKEIVKEAMTGNEKFTDKSAVSTHMMKFDVQGNSEFTVIDDSVVTKYTNSTTFNISFKSSGTGGRAWTALKGIYKENYDLEQMIEEAMQETDQQLLSEGLFSRGKKFIGQAMRVVTKWIMIFLQKVWNKIKAALLKGLDFALSLMNKKIAVSGEGYSFSGGW